MTLFQQESALAHCARATVELLHQEIPDFLAFNL